MVTPESRVKDYLRKRIKALKGEVRFVKWIGRNNAPDTLVLLHYIPPTLVETKARGKVERAAQAREFEKLRRFGFRVLVLDTEYLIDYYFPLPTATKEQASDSVLP